MDYRAERRFDCKRHGVRYAVVDVYELDRKAAETEAVARLLREYLRIVKQVMLLKLQLNERSGERRCVYGNVERLHNVRYSADVVLVTVGKDDSLYPRGVCLQISYIGYNNVNAVHLLVGKAETAVYNNDVGTAFKCGHVFADLSETAKGYDFNFWCHNYSVS